MTSPRPASAVTASTGPRLAHSSETRCGARSHSPPFSRRHGVLNGLPSARAVPSQTTLPPPHRCRATSASQARTSGWNRAVKNTTDATPASATARVRASAAGSDVAMGFSSSRCLPAAAALVARPACTSGGTANATASTSARKASKSPNPAAPWLAASCAAAAGLRPHTAASSMPSVDASAGACTMLAQCPVPASPKRSVTAAGRGRRRGRCHPGRRRRPRRSWPAPPR